MKITLKQIMRETSRVTDVEEDILTGRSRLPQFCDARSLYCRIARYYDYTTVAIGKSLGRQYSTVINSLKKHEALYATEKKYKSCFDLLLECMNELEKK